MGDAPEASRVRRQALAIAAAALVLRLGLALAPVDTSAPDSVTYLEPAASLARGEGYLDGTGRPTAARPPGSPA
ncbi:MAG: hypothetical protein KIT58_11680, partial [Planctomycetota bacterium]|nr:hypothetical protein [Planctomycetota bacterium]